MQCKLNGDTFIRPSKSFHIDLTQRAEVEAIRKREGIIGEWISGPGRAREYSESEEYDYSSTCWLLVVPDDDEAARLHAALTAA